jgi:hypothetical protein
MAVSMGLVSVMIGAFNDAKVKAVLGLTTEEPLYIIPVGRPKEVLYMKKMKGEVVITVLFFLFVLPVMIGFCILTDPFFPSPMYYTGEQVRYHGEPARIMNVNCDQSGCTYMIYTDRNFETNFVREYDLQRR